MIDKRVLISVKLKMQNNIEIFHFPSVLGNPIPSSISLYNTDTNLGDSISIFNTNIVPMICTYSINKKGPKSDIKTIEEMNNMRLK